MNNIIIKHILATTVQVVGNKVKDEGASFAHEETQLGVSELFIKKMIETSFTTLDQKHFTYIGGLELNPVYQFVSRIFDNHEDLVAQSVNLATFLYEQSIHPKIKSGEFYISLLECEVDGDLMTAVALLKSEKKEPFLTTENNGRVINVKTYSGTGLKNLDKGCLILNKYREKGYVVLTVDRTNSGNDANYWTENFLHVEGYDDDYHGTVSMINACNSFFSILQKEHGIDRSELAKAVCRNKEVLSQSENDVETDKLPEQLFEDKDYQKMFSDFLAQYDKDQLPDHFTPKKEIVQRKITKKPAVIRLDNNFEVKLLNSAAEMTKGYDEDSGRFYYKLWFENEL